MLTNVTQNPIQAIIESNYLGVLFFVLLGLALRSHTETTKEVGIGSLVIRSAADHCVCTDRYPRISLSIDLNDRVVWLSRISSTSSGIGRNHVICRFSCLSLRLLFIKENPYPLIFDCGSLHRSSAANIPSI